MTTALCLFGCGPSAPTVPTVPRTVSPRDLYNSYADGSERWTNQPVRIVLPAGNFVVAGKSLLWHVNRDTDAPAIVFTFTAAPETRPGEPVTLTGFCRGRKSDDGKRASGFTWHVAVDGCTVR